MYNRFLAVQLVSDSKSVIQSFFNNEEVLWIIVARWKRIRIQFSHVHREELNFSADKLAKMGPALACGVSVISSVCF